MSQKTKNHKKNKNLNKESRLLGILIYVAILLLIFWLLLLLWLIVFHKSEGKKENAFRDRFYFEMKTSKSSSDTSHLGEGDTFQTESSYVGSESKSRFDVLERDELQPEMKDFLRDRDLSIRNIEDIFENMKSPKEITALHSTFGRDVIYIYHTHSRESFLPYLKNTDNPKDAFHSNANITYVGEMLGRALERRGVGTTVDSTDIVKVLGSRNLEYNSSYNLSGELVSSARKENRKLEIFLDIHRDSLRKDSTTIEMNEEDYAQLLFVVGTGHDDFEKNLMFAEGLHKMLSTQYPGLSKGILQKDSSQGNGVYNQDISPNSVIVEIGGVDNTVDELYRTTEMLANVISDYYWHGEK